MEVIATILIAAYGVLMLSLLIGWVRLRETSRHTPFHPLPKLSVIIAARNEESTIPHMLMDLDQQSYPDQNWQAIVINDDSTDATQTMLEQESRQYPWLKVIELRAEQGKVGKKAALLKGIDAAKYEVIVTTDADCRVPERWLELIAQEFQQIELQFLSGPVAYFTNGGLLEKLQAVEFAGLIGAGAGCISLAQPSMCNGANLAFRKSAFNTVNGYQGNDGIASGDDEFLLHKIAGRFGRKAYSFLKSRDAIVQTAPRSEFKGLLEQRIRWASKWSHYTRLSPRLLAVFIGSAYMILAVALLSVAIGFISPGFFLRLFLFKTLIDLIFFLPILHFFRQVKLWWLVLVLQVTYPFFVVIIFFAGFRKNYTWKNRVITPS